jgi:hypothetical protein
MRIVCMKEAPMPAKASTATTRFWRVVLNGETNDFDESACMATFNFHGESAIQD